MSAERLHQIIERLSLLLRSSQRQVAAENGVQLVHLEILIFLLSANRYSDTPAAITEYLGVTKGTVSQSLKLLEERGFIGKESDPSDARLVHCRLSEAGRKLASESFPAAAMDLNDSTALDLLPGLEAYLRSLQRANGHQTFGVCKTCQHFGAERPGFCGLTSEPLSDQDAGQICREHRAA